MQLLYIALITNNLDRQIHVDIYISLV